MKQLKEAIKNNAIILTIIDLILVTLYLLLIKKLCNKSFNIDLYDLLILWIMIVIWKILHLLIINLIYIREALEFCRNYMII